MQIKIAIADDHSLFREGLISLLKGYPEIKVVCQAGNGKELLNELKNHDTDIILLDLEMPELDGIETIKRVKKKYPAIKIIVLTMHNEEGLIFNLMGKGANGFLPKDKSVELLIDAIYAVKEKDFYYNELVTNAILKGVRGNLSVQRSFKATPLTDREIDVVKLICKQYNMREIAEILNVSTRTVESHRDNIMKKTGSKNIAGVVMHAIDHHLLDDGDTLLT